MKHLVTVRHGEDVGCAGDGSLSPRGRDNMGRLATALAAQFTGQRVKILSSPKIRATESAEILSVAFGSPGVTSHDVLWSETRHPENLSAALELVQQEGTEEVDVLVLVTHLEYAGRFPTYVLEVGLGRPPSVRPPLVQKGQANVINWETAEWSQVKP